MVLCSICNWFEDNTVPTLNYQVPNALFYINATVLRTEDCYNIVTALCKRHYLEDNKKMKKAIKDSFSSITAVISPDKMEVFIIVRVAFL